MERRGEKGAILIEMGISHKTAIILGAIVLVGFLLWLVSAPLFYVLVSIIGIVLVLLSALVMVVTFRKAKSVSPQSLGISIGVSVAVALLYAALAKGSAGGGILVLSLICGTLVGAGWGLTNTMFVEAGTIRSRGNAWYLLVWAVLFAFTQALALITGRPPAVAMILLFTGTGLVIGNSGLSLARYYKLKFRIQS
jgi:hypothetical protein